MPERLAVILPAHCTDQWRRNADEPFLNDHQPIRHSALIKAALLHVQFETITRCCSGCACRLGAVTGQSPLTVGKMLDAMIELGLLREVTGMKRNRIYEYTPYLEPLNREGE